MNRADIARLALQEAQAHSFEKVSMQDLANKAGVKKPSFYYHFPSKQAVAVAAIEEAQSLLLDYFNYYEQRTPDRQISAYVQFFAKHMKPIHNLCPGAGFVSAWSSQSSDVHEAVQMLYRTHYEHLVQLINSGVKQRVFSPSLSPEDTANSIFCMLQGSLLTARVTQSTNVFSGLSCAIEQLLRPAKHSEGESS